MSEEEQDDFEALSGAVALEGQFHPELTLAQLAEKVLEDSTPLVAQNLVRMATNGASESIRFRASVYILDRVLGKAGDDPSKKDPWDNILDAITVEASK